MSRTEQLLSEVEDINFAGGTVVPEEVVEALLQAAAEVEAADGLRPFRRLHGQVSTASAQSYLFRLQERILSSPEQVVAAPKLRFVRVHPVRREDAPTDAVWHYRLQAQAQRAWDRWALSDEQAQRAREEAFRGDDAAVQCAADRTCAARVARAERDAMCEAFSDLVGVRFQPRREAPRPAIGTRVVARGVSLDLATGRVRIGREAKDLRVRESQILSLLVAHPGCVLTREGAIRSIHGDDPRVDTASRLVDMHIGSLRRELGPLGGAIATVPGSGWAWDGPPATLVRTVGERARLRTTPQTQVSGRTIAQDPRHACRSASRGR